MPSPSSPSGSVVETHGGRYLVRGAVTVLDGDWTPRTHGRRGIRRQRPGQGLVECSRVSRIERDTSEGSESQRVLCRGGLTRTSSLASLTVESRYPRSNPTGNTVPTRMPLIQSALNEIHSLVRLTPGKSVSIPTLVAPVHLTKQYPRCSWRQIRSSESMWQRVGSRL